MKLAVFVLAASVELLPIGTFAFAQTVPAVDQAGSQLTPKVQMSIDEYIHGSWKMLRRSMTDCGSLVDVKVATEPVLYLPHGMPLPEDVQQAQQHCKVRVLHLPIVLHKIGVLDGSKLAVQGLLYLPKPYVVPGGRFNEMYGWDSYFIVLGLLADGQKDMAEDMLTNFIFEIENYGGLLNANRTYFLSRSQPPLFSQMVREVYQAKKKSDEAAANAWLEHAYTAAAKDYSLWTRPEHRAGKTKLARYHDYGTGPVPEMEDDSTYYSDVIRWIESHKDLPAPEGKASDYLVRSQQNPNDAESKSLKQTSCDIHTSKVCAQAWVDGYRLSAGFYAGDRAMRESGFDTTFRFGQYSGSTENFAPVCLNSLLYRYERNMEEFATILHKRQDATAWKHRAEVRLKAINRYLWNEREQTFKDYNFVVGSQWTYPYASIFYPLWAGVATKEQANAVEHKLPQFEHAGGLAMSGTESGVQWDSPYGWAPAHWFAVEGLRAYGFEKDATRVANEFMQMVATSYESDGTIREKYNVVEKSAKVTVRTGYRSNVIGFGWTNGVYSQLSLQYKAPGDL